MQILSAYLVLPVIALPRKLSQYSLLVHGLASLLSCVLRVPRLEDMVTTSWDSQPGTKPPPGAFHHKHGAGPPHLSSHLSCANGALVLSKGGCAGTADRKPWRRTLLQLSKGRGRVSPWWVVAPRQDVWPEQLNCVPDNMQSESLSAFFNKTGICYLSK